MAERVDDPRHFNRLKREWPVPSDRSGYGRGTPGSYPPKRGRFDEVSPRDFDRGPPPGRPGFLGRGSPCPQPPPPRRLPPGSFPAGPPDRGRGTFPPGPLDGRVHFNRAPGALPLVRGAGPGRGAPISAWDQRPRDAQTANLDGREHWRAAPPPPPSAAVRAAEPPPPVRQQPPTYPQEIEAGELISEPSQAKPSNKASGWDQRPPPRMGSAPPYQPNGLANSSSALPRTSTLPSTPFSQSQRGPPLTAPHVQTALASKTDPRPPPLYSPSKLEVSDRSLEQNMDISPVGKQEPVSEPPPLAPAETDHNAKVRESLQSLQEPLSAGGAAEDKHETDVLAGKQGQPEDPPKKKRLGWGQGLARLKSMEQRGIQDLEQAGCKTDAPLTELVSAGDTLKQDLVAESNEQVAEHSESRPAEQLRETGGADEEPDPQLVEKEEQQQLAHSVPSQELNEEDVQPKVSVEHLLADIEKVDQEISSVQKRLSELKASHNAAAEVQRVTAAELSDYATNPCVVFDSSDDDDEGHALSQVSVSESESSMVCDEGEQRQSNTAQSAANTITIDEPVLPGTSFRTQQGTKKEEEPVLGVATRKLHVQLVLEQNKQHAEAAHRESLQPLPRAVVDSLKLGEGNAPLYSKPDDVPSYEDCKKIYDSLKHVFQRVLRQRKYKVIVRQKELAVEYRELYEKLKQQKGQQNSSKEKVNERNPWSRSGAVRSDYEEMQILHQLNAVERMKNMTQLPDLLLDPNEKEGRRFINRNGLVEDPLAEIERDKLTLPWTADEKRIFMEKVLQYPKDFHKISSFLENRSTADCIEFYYQNQKGDEFANVRRKQQLKKRRLQSDMKRNAYLGLGHAANPRMSAESLPTRGSGSGKATDQLPLAGRGSRGGRGRGIPRSRGGRGRGGLYREPSEVVVDPPVKEAEPIVTEGELQESEFVEAVRIHGKDIKAIARHLGNRSPSAVKTYYNKHKRRLGLDKVLIDREQHDADVVDDVKVEREEKEAPTFAVLDGERPPLEKPGRIVATLRLGTTHNIRTSAKEEPADSPGAATEARPEAPAAPQPRATDEMEHQELPKPKLDVKQEQEERAATPAPVEEPPLVVPPPAIACTPDPEEDVPPAEDNYPAEHHHVEQYPAQLQAVDYDQEPEPPAVQYAAAEAVIEDEAMAEEPEMPLSTGLPPLSTFPVPFPPAVQSAVVSSLPSPPPLLNPYTDAADLAVASAAAAAAAAANPASMLQMQMGILPPHLFMGMGAGQAAVPPLYGLQPPNPLAGLTGLAGGVPFTGASAWPASATGHAALLQSLMHSGMRPATPTVAPAEPPPLATVKSEPVAAVQPGPSIATRSVETRETEERAATVPSGAYPDNSASAYEGGYDGGYTAESQANKRSLSYWSHEEKEAFMEVYKVSGRDWSRLQEAIPTKTLTQIKNYYQNYKNKLGLDKLELPANAVQPGIRKRKMDSSDGDPSRNTPTVTPAPTPPPQPDAHALQHQSNSNQPVVEGTPLANLMKDVAAVLQSASANPQNPHMQEAAEAALQALRKYKLAQEQNEQVKAPAPASSTLPSPVVSSGAQGTSILQNLHFSAQQHDVLSTPSLSLSSNTPPVDHHPTSTTPTEHKLQPESKPQNSAFLSMLAGMAGGADRAPNSQQTNAMPSLKQQTQAIKPPQFPSTQSFSAGLSNQLLPEAMRVQLPRAPDLKLPPLVQNSVKPQAQHAPQPQAPAGLNMPGVGVGGGTSTAGAAAAGFLGGQWPGSLLGLNDYASLQGLDAGRMNPQALSEMLRSSMLQQEAMNPFAAAPNAAMAGLGQNVALQRYLSSIIAQAQGKFASNLFPGRQDMAANQAQAAAWFHLAQQGIDPTMLLSLQTAGLNPSLAASMNSMAARFGAQNNLVPQLGSLDALFHHLHGGAVSAAAGPRPPSSAALAMMLQGNLAANFGNGAQAALLAGAGSGPLAERALLAGAGSGPLTDRPRSASGYAGMPRELDGGMNPGGRTITTGVGEEKIAAGGDSTHNESLGMRPPLFQPPKRAFGDGSSAATLPDALRGAGAMFDPGLLSERMFGNIDFSAFTGAANLGGDDGRQNGGS